MDTGSSNEKKAYERYLFKPHVGSSHDWALRHLANCQPSQRVLDIGPGSGFAGKALKNQGLSELYAIEPDQSTAALLTDTYTKISPTLEQLDETDFDLVILMDVLEHMSEPEKFARLVMQRLKPDGRLLISVPNVAHWSVRLPLLFGFFEYQERGPLDKTHLQFFSKRRFQQLCNLDGKLKCLEQNVSIEPLELVLPESITDNQIFRKFSHGRQFFAQLIPGLMAYQFLALLQKK